MLEYCQSFDYLEIHVVILHIPVYSHPSSLYLILISHLLSCDQSKAVNWWSWPVSLSSNIIYSQHYWPSNVTVKPSQKESGERRMMFPSLWLIYQLMFSWLKFHPSLPKCLYITLKKTSKIFFGPQVVSSSPIFSTLEWPRDFPSTVLVNSHQEGIYTNAAQPFSTVKNN